ncbi:MAG: rod shape-determining protein MreC [Halothiobacillus sp.]
MTLFESHRPSVTKLMVLVLLSVLLMALDRAGNIWAYRINTSIGSFTDGIVRIVQTPAQWGANLTSSFQDSLKKNQTIEQLQQENLLLKGQMQQFFDLQKEVDHLKKLLHGQNRVVPNVLLARLIAVNDGPEQQSFTINRGINDGVRPGQPVIDGQGIVGQILRSSLSGAVVVEIDSRRHALSVRLGDTGFVGILNGTGKPNTLIMDRIPDRFPLKVGDLLTTTGLDGVFPKGYPVARVSQIHDDRSQAFINIVATPVANLNQISEVLVLTDPPDAPPPPNSLAEKATTQNQPRINLINAGKAKDPLTVPLLLPPGFKNLPAAPVTPPSSHGGNTHAR